MDRIELEKMCKELKEQFDKLNKAIIDGFNLIDKNKKELSKTNLVINEH
jgi:hypothetical protein